MNSRKIKIAAVSAVMGLIVGSLLAYCGNRGWEPAPRPLQSGVQAPHDPPLGTGTQRRAEGSMEPLDGLAGCMQPGVVAVECLEGDPPRCAAEDGDPSGRWCLWVDPDTGNVYSVDSSEYRR